MAQTQDQQTRLYIEHDAGAALLHPALESLDAARHSLASTSQAPAELGVSKNASR